MYVLEDHPFKLRQNIYNNYRYRSVYYKKNKVIIEFSEDIEARTPYLQLYPQLTLNYTYQLYYIIYNSFIIYNM